jgi:hypothetical protein
LATICVEVFPMPRPLATACFVLICAGLASPAAAGQAVYSPSSYPSATAADRDWFRQGEPIYFAGDSYHQGGPPVHFNPDLMIHTGSFDGAVREAS